MYNKLFFIFILFVVIFFDFEFYVYVWVKRLRDFLFLRVMGFLNMWFSKVGIFFVFWGMILRCFY